MAARFWLAGLLLCAACSVIPTGGPIDAGRDEAMIKEVAVLLSAQPGREALSAYVGAEPFACAAVSEEDVICTWEVRDEAAARDLARTIPTRSRVNLVCQLPADGGPRAFDSCSVHPRHSNRSSWKTNKGRIKMDRAERSWEREQAEEFRVMSRSMFESASTPLELSRLIGKGPEECVPIGSVSRRCIWYADASTYGHGTLAMVIDASPRKKVMMECVFLAEGDARAPESCVIAVGAPP